MQMSTIMSSNLVDGGFIDAVKDHPITFDWIAKDTTNITAWFRRRRWREYDGIFMFTRIIPDAHIAAVEDVIPIVLLRNERPSLPLNTVSHDETSFGVMLTEHLADEGHASIGFITPYTGDYVKERFLGYRSVLRSRGLPERSDWVIGCTMDGDPDPARSSRIHAQTAAYAAQNARAFVELKERPTAVICAADQCALTLRDEAAKAGLRVPGDIAIASVNDIIDDRDGEWRNTGLTTIRQNGWGLAYYGTEMLIDIIDGRRPRRAQRVLIPPKLIVRRSSLKRSLAPSAADDFEFRRSMTDFIARNFTKDNLLSAAAGFNGVSEGYLLKKFHRVFGMKFGAYVIDARLTYAGFLIRNTARTAVSILFESGFKTEKTFYTSFRKKFGASPAEYRQEHQRSDRQKSFPARDRT